MFQVDSVKNIKYVEFLKETLQILKRSGVDDIFLIGSVGVSGHLGRAFKTFNDIEAITRKENFSKIVSVLKAKDYKVLENLSDRTSFMFNDLWIGFIDRSKKFESLGMDPEGAYLNGKEAKLYGVKFYVINPIYLKALYELAIEKNKKKKKQYKYTLKLLSQQSIS